MKLGSLNSTPNNSLFSNIGYIAVGAAYGLLIGISFVLMWTFINSWLYRDLPLGIDLSLVAGRGALIGLSLALIGAVTCLFNETWLGLTVGSAIAGLLALAGSLIISSTGAGLTLILILFTLAPIAVMSLPIAWIIRRLADKHAFALNLKWSAVRIVILALIAAVLGAGFGYFMRMPENAVLAVRLVHEHLQPTSESREDAVSQLPNLQEHAGTSYKLFEEPSAESTEGFDIRAEYEDGYVVECVVVVYPGFSPYIRHCDELKR